MRSAFPIRVHLAILVLAIALPLLGLITYNAVNQARFETQRAHAQTAQAARAVAAETERTLQRTKVLLAHLSHQPLVRSLDGDHCDPIFEKFKGLFPQYTNLLTVNRDGERICSAIKPPPGAPPKVDPKLYLSETLRSQSFTIGQATRGVFSGRWILIAAHPVADEAGAAAGVVGVSIDLASLTLAPGLSDLSEQSAARIVDADGLVLASSVQPQQSIGQRSRNDGGTQRIVGTAAIAGTSWRAEVEVPTDQVLGPVRQRIRVSAAVAAGVLLLAAVLAYLIGRRTARPIEAIAAAARRATSSGVPADATGLTLHAGAAPREIQALAGDFATMLQARTRAEEALRDGEQRLAVTLHSIGDAVIATDRHGRIDRMNATAERLTGWPFAKAAGRPLAEVFRIVDSDTRDIVADPVELVLARGEAVELSNHTILLAADGRNYQISDSAAPIRDAAGEVLGVVLVFSDVTRQYEVQQALREHDAQLRMITDMMPGPVSRVDRHGRYLFANAAHERWFGHRGDKVVGRTQLEVMGEAYSLEIEPQLERVRAGEKVTFETSFQSAGEGRLHALVSLLPDWAEDGTVRGHFSVAYEITKRIRAEEALRESEERLRLVLRGSNDAPWDWNIDTGERFYSQRFWQMLGYDESKQGLGAEAANRAVHPDDLPHLEAVIRDALRQGRDGFELEFRLRHRDGHDVPVLSRAFILRNERGCAQRVSGVNTDLTERKRAEAERRALEEQLRESQKMESIGTLAGGIAHDFNNILGSILGNVAMAREDLAESHPVQDTLKQIGKSSLRARDLVEQILAFSRKQPQRLVNQSLRPLIEETLAMLRSTLPARIELHSVLSHAPLHAEIDSTQVQQVLVNLATNAWHAIGEGKGRITVGVEPLWLDGAAARRVGGLAAGRHAHLWVSDTGSGMDAAIRARIFEPFFTTKPAGQGTGLGLAVVHGIVSAHHGAITVDSAPGIGTSFHVYLSASEPQAAAKSSEPIASQPLRGHGEHVLYIDDDEVMVAMVERLLQRSGFEVTCSRSAKDAVARITDAQEPIDFVVTDFNMPDLSGLDVAQEVARRRPGTPVVVVSGYVSEDLREGALRAGVRSLLEKQHTHEELGPLIQRILAEQAQPVGVRGPGTD